MSNVTYAEKVIHTSMVDVKTEGMVEVIEALSLGLSNLVAVAVVSKLQDCDCVACRTQSHSALEGIMESTVSATHQAIEENLKVYKIHSLFGPTSHNEQLVQEILIEEEKASGR